MSGALNFYSTRGVYGCFSNFSRHSFVVLGASYPTSEHYFQAMKFKGTPHEDAVRRCSTPAAAAKMGRNRSLPLRPDWEKVKDEVMYDACLAKFSQRPELGKVLLGTGELTLVEHTAKDKYWGDGGDGSGKNMLGKTLMRVREALRREGLSTAAVPPPQGDDDADSNNNDGDRQAKKAKKN
eukprot:PhM_4_TR13138/c0_g1_i1/m.96244/K09935/K09935; uncharacterized protein